MKLEAEITLFNEFPINVKMLIDGGSTHSFISPFALNESHKAHLVTPDTPLKQKRSFIITSATQDVSSQCTVVIATIKIQDWIGKFQFTISDKITKNDVVIGRDFLQYYKVQVNHGSNEMIIGDFSVKFQNGYGKRVTFDPAINDTDIVHNSTSLENIFKLDTNDPSCYAL